MLLFLFCVLIIYLRTVGIYSSAFSRLERSSRASAGDSETKNHPKENRVAVTHVSLFFLRVLGDLVDLVVVEFHATELLRQ